jgi:hypothetical protein
LYSRTIAYVLLHSRSAPLYSPSPCQSLAQSRFLPVLNLSLSLLPTLHPHLVHPCIIRLCLLHCRYQSYEPPWYMQKITSCLSLFFIDPSLDQRKNLHHLTASSNPAGFLSSQEKLHPPVAHQLMLPPLAKYLGVS